MSKKLIGLKLADGTFYPVLNEGIPVKKHLKVTASSDNQTSMKIELFRASDESFADAEYIQTMVLDQMLPQKKENHLIDLVINLDENDVLTADLSDAQSGLKKNASIPLADFAGQTESEPAIGSMDNDLPDFGDIDIPEESTVDTTEDALPDFGDLDIPEEPAGDGADSIVEDFLATPVAEDTTDSVRAVDEAPMDFGDLDIPEEPTIDNVITDEPATEDALPDFGDFDIPEESNANDVITDDVITEEPAGETDTGLPVFDDLGEREPVADTTNDALPDFGDLDIPEESATDNVIADEPVTEDALPDFGDLDIPEEPANNDTITEGALPDFDDFDIPQEPAADETITNAELPDFDDSNLSFSDNSSSDDLRFNDFSEDSASDSFSPETFDIDSIDLDSDDMDFAENGTDDSDSGDGTYTQSQGITDFDFLDKKTRLPFVPLLCIICAVVSLLCLLGMFFIFLNGKSKNTVPVQPTVQEQQNKISVYSGSAEPEKPVQAAVARDNVIVVVDSPVVVPSVPEKIVTAADEKKYKVKWGDTLWDIAESYYKDPWMYKKIAALNNIKNPDFILSGTWIVLPPK
ncbi:MAG: LysM peptidoglycan-binding domain-containing protein [Spirochaetaceae bacterium]|nr:LysM peptidoglycan-binding domain-containing protein [Spirochaetaceae bacterium]